MVFTKVGLSMISKRGNNSFEVYGKHATITLMKPTDFKEINQWCINEGWNLGISDSETYYNIDPSGHFILKSDEIMASISLIKHSNHFFTLGPFIVKPSYRQQGVGVVLWDYALARMKDEAPNALIALYAVASQVTRYQKSGFIKQFVNQRWYLKPSELNVPLHQQCVPITPENIRAVSLYDEHHYFTNREFIFTDMLKKPNIKGLAYMVDNKIKGFGIIRPCVHGFRLGTLVADSKNIAESLILCLQNYSKGEPVFIDVPEQNLEGISCMTALNAVRKPQEDTVTMIKGTLEPYHKDIWNTHFGLLSLEIG